MVVSSPHSRLPRLGQYSQSVGAYVLAAIDERSRESLF